MRIPFRKYTQDIRNALEAISAEEVEKCIDLLARAKHQNSTVYLLGNGGSAATASHFANDLLKMGGLRAVSLPDLVPSMTAFGNDNGWDNMYADMLRRMLLPMDVVVGISCSGMSSNVIRAMELARTINLPTVRTVVLTGNTWDTPLTRLKPDILIHVPFADIKVQEDCHLIICHVIAGGL